MYYFNYEDQDLLGFFDNSLMKELESIENPDPVNVQKSIDSLFFLQFGDSSPVLYLNGIGHTIDTVTGFVKSLTKTKESVKIKSFNQLIMDLETKAKVAYSKVIDSVKDDKDKILTDAQNRLDVFKEHSLASGNIGELNTLNDSVLTSENSTHLMIPY